MNNLHKQVKEICLVHCQHFTLVLHLKGIFFSFAKKDPPKTKQSSILERQMADRVNLSLLSKITVWWNAWLPWKFRKNGAVCWTPLREHGGLLADSHKVIHICKYLCIILKYLLIHYFIFSCIALFFTFHLFNKKCKRQDKREILGKSNIGIYNIHCRKELTIVNNKLVVSKYSDE